MNFGELRKAEVQLRRIHLPRTSVNKGYERERAGGAKDSGPGEMNLLATQTGHYQTGRTR
jgi:hypothetical protein